MKNKVLIIENNDCKFFTTKQVLESQLRVDVDAVTVTSGTDLVKATADLNPATIMYCPNGGVADLLATLKKRRTNRRNTEITLLLAQDLDDQFAGKVKEFIDAFHKAKMARAA